jgi:lipoic acid synthetase
MAWFDRIIPCGLRDKAVTSLASEGIGVSMADVVDLLASHAAHRWAPDGIVDRQDVVIMGHRSPSLSVTSGPTAAGTRLRIRLRQAGVEPDEGLALAERKPSWLRIPARMGDDFLGLKRTMRQLDLVTVCEEAGCPNIFECWADGTATFMINGERCTRACGFCLVDTRHPEAVDPDEPERVAAAVEELGLMHAVVTAVARDDLADGGASGFVATIAAIRRRCPHTAVEVLVSDCKGSEQAIAALIGAAPDVFNHNLETVARLQRAVRPSAGYARSLSVLARAKAAGLTVKSGMILGMGETETEVEGALADLRSVGVDIVTLGQYLRPSAAHLPVARWWTPEQFDRLRVVGEAMGFAHVQASPLTRSSYHARAAAASARTDGPATSADASTARRGVPA